MDALNAYRFLAGLPDNVVLDSEYTRYCQAGALVNYVNDQLSHYPSQPSDMSQELYQTGAAGCSHSNIAWSSRSGVNLISMTNLWMGDSDTYNIQALGHRRWLLNPKMGKTGFGSVCGSNGTYSQVYAIDFSGSSSVDTVVWPAQQMPTSYFSASLAWNISSDTGFSDDVSIKLIRERNGASTVWNFSAQSADGVFYRNDDGYGQRHCLIFRPDNIDSYDAGDVFSVTVTENGSVTKRYPVCFFSL